MISALALSPSLDVTYVVDELEGIQRPRSVHRVAGGKALNAARAAAALGARVSAVAVLGAGAGRDVADGARADGVDLHAVFGTEPTRSCVSIFSRASGRLTEIYERAVPVSVSTAAAALDAAVALAAARPGWWFVSGGLPDAAPAGLLADVVRRLHDAGVRVAVDSHGPALRSAVGAQPDLVKVNRWEALELVGAGGGAGAGGAARGGAAGAGAAAAGEPSVPELLAAVHALAEGLVVITDGADGAWATDGDRVLRARLAGHTGNFPVGSGDSFLGGLLVALDNGADLADALALAIATGTANAQVPGAAILDPTLARRLAQEVQVTTAV
ncbi:1-phosphofructokinase family hexose kinase [Promicromonospora sp. NPDC057138]|uniref:1-phosphofructokinase family hexose kinase n=1 Tax=Promicromonospora sp. NPDC057138 TaxID=3346031 RepID=UPI00363E5503